MASLERILVTGATGFIGSHLVEALLKDGRKIAIVKRPDSNLWRIASFQSRLKIYNNDDASLRRLFKKIKPQLVIHLAAYYVKEHRSITDAEELIRSNVLFPVKILELMRQHQVRYFINTGTCFEYDLSRKEKIKETSPLAPQNLYAATKLAFQKILRYYAGAYQMKAVNFRLFPPYGPKDNEKLVNHLLNNLTTGQRIFQSPSQQQWNFTYVKDIVTAYRKAVVYLLKMKSDYEDFNIGIDKTYSVKQIIDVLERLTGARNLVSYDRPYPPKEIFYINCSNSKARRLLGWQPRYSLERGLKETYEWYCLRHQRAKN